MAVFNPDLPKTNDPNYLGYSKGIEQPKPNTTLGTALTGISQVFDAGVKAADTLVKQDIQNRTYATMDPIKQQLITDLTDIRNQQRAKGITGGLPTGESKDVSDPNDAYAQADPSDIPGTGFPMSLLPKGQETTPPAGINNLEQKVLNFKEGYEGGKYPKSYYDAQIDKISKELNNRYPGYREYISKTISNVTGENDANVLQNSLIREINQNATAGNFERTHAMKVFEKHSDQADAPMRMQRYFNGQDNFQDVFKWGATIDLQKAERVLEKQKRDDRKETDAETDRTDERSFTKLARQEMTNQFEAIKWGSGIKTVKDLQDRLADHAEGRRRMTQVELTQAGEAMTSLNSKMYARLRAIGVQQNYGFDGKKMNEIIDNEMQLFKMIGASISKEQFTFAESAQRYMKATTDDTAQKMFDNKQLGPYVRVMGALQGMGPQVAEKMLEKYIMDPQYGNIGDAVVPFLQWHRAQALVGPHVLNKDQPPPTLNGSVDDAMNNQITHPKVYADFVSHMEELTNPQVKDAYKQNIVQYYFHPDNGPVISKFQRDYTDENGRFVPGQASVYAKILGADKIKEAYRVTQDKPELRRMISGWVDNNFGNVLLRNTLKDFSTLDYNNLNVRYDPNTFSMAVVAKPLPYEQSGDRQAIMNRDREEKKAKEIVNRFNIAMRATANVAEAEKVDPSQYLLGKLMQFGFKPSDAINVQGITGLVGNAVFEGTYPPEERSGNAPQSPTNAPGSRKTEAPRVSSPPETVPTEISHYTAPERRRSGDLNSWIRNPSGEEPLPPTGRRMRPGQNLTDGEILGIDYGPIENARVPPVKSGP